MKNIGVFVSENFQFLEVKFSIHLNRSVFVMRFVSLYRPVQAKMCLRTCEKRAGSHPPARATNIIRDFTLHSYIL